MPPQNICQGVALNTYFDEYISCGQPRVLTVLPEKAERHLIFPEENHAPVPGRWFEIKPDWKKTQAIEMHRNRLTD